MALARQIAQSINLDKTTSEESEDAEALAAKAEGGEAKADSVLDAAAGQMAQE